MFAMMSAWIWQQSSWKRWASGPRSKNNRIAPQSPAAKTWNRSVDTAMT
jgi:hypothetical protein